MTTSAAMLASAHLANQRPLTVTFIARILSGSSW
jgi:hypothetical protein